MPRYIYTAKPSPAKTIHGEIEADSEQEAVNKLNQLGYFPVSLEALGIDLAGGKTLSLWKVSRHEVVIFTRQISSLLDSGLSIMQSLGIVVNQTKNKYFKAILNEIISLVKEGVSFSKGLSSYPAIFPPLYSSLILAGEASGAINKSMNRLADFLEKEEEFYNSLRSSLVYPLFIFSVGLLTIIVLLVFVIPRLVTMFEDMGQMLPLPTLILINLSNFLRSYGWLILAGLFILFFVLRRFQKTSSGRVIFDRLKIKLILLGPVVLKSEIGRIMRTLSLLLSSGIPITTSLDIAVGIAQNSLLKLELKDFKEKITGGQSLSLCFQGSKVFPEFVSGIVSVGEETGKLDNSFLRIANDYEREVEQSLKLFLRLLEPVIILFLGLVVGFMVLSMLLPIFQLNLIVR